MKISTTNLYLTKKGLKNLKKETGRLKRDKIALESQIRDMDKTDNRDLSYLRNERLNQLSIIEGEIFEKKRQLKRAMVLPSSRNAFEVAIGSMVELIDKATGRRIRYQLVDTLEADPTRGRISINSPLGSRLVGKKQADEVKLQVGALIKNLQLVKVS